MSDNGETSGIGTKEYWDEVYKVELLNFKDHGEEGDIWFGRSCMERIMKWLKSNNIDKNGHILDIGCGNGMMLLRLTEEGFQNLTGIDFVREAIHLATGLAEKCGYSIAFEVADFLNDSLSYRYSCQTFNVIIDKGTYDAIGMCPTAGEAKREMYRKRVLHCLENSGIFIIVSCNWTKEELVNHFNGFKMLDEIQGPTLSFGGRTGYTTTTLVMVKTNEV